MVVAPSVQDVQKRPRPANWLIFQGRESLPFEKLHVGSFEKLHVNSVEKLHVGSFEKKKNGDHRIVPEAARRHVETRTCASEDRPKKPSTAHVVSLTLEDQSRVKEYITPPPTALHGHSHMKRTATLPLLTSPSQGLVMYRTRACTSLSFSSLSCLFVQVKIQRPRCTRIQCMIYIAWLSRM